MPISNDMRDRVALVTGSSGVGRAAALAFAQRGAKVALAGLNTQSGQETERLITGMGGQALFIETNLSESDSAKQTVARAWSHFRRLDYAFNAAGIEGDAAPLVNQSLDNYTRVFDLNVRGLVLCMKYELRLMLRNSSGGVIVNNSSVGGLGGLPRLSIYSAAKHAVIGLTKSVALEVAGAGIRVNAVCPAEILNGPFPPEEDQNDDEGATERATPMRVGRLGIPVDNYPMERFGAPEAVASAVVWLCSDEASFVTGHAMRVDGGLMA